MKDELENKLRQEFSDAFEGEIPRMECGDGWYKILHDLMTKIRTTGEKIGIAQIKEKFGGLRFYIESTPIGSIHFEAIRTFISEAEKESMRTCEVCGKPGEIRDQGRWIRTLCDEHTEKK